MTVILLCMAASAACAVTGSAWSLGTPIKALGGRERAMRTVSVVSALIAMLLIPVFVMMNTAGLGHRLDLYNSDIITEGKDVLFAKLDRFLFDGLSGDNIGNVLKSLSFETSGIIWVAMAFLFVMLLSDRKSTRLNSSHP